MLLSVSFDVVFGCYSEYSVGLCMDLLCYSGESVGFGCYSEYSVGLCMDLLCYSGDSVGLVATVSIL